MPLALEALRIQLIVPGIELEFYIALFFVSHHQIQILADGAANESGLARIKSQNVHANANVLMKDFPASLPLRRPRRRHS